MKRSEVYNSGWVCGFSGKVSYKNVKFNEPLKGKQIDNVFKKEGKK